MLFYTAIGFLTALKTGNNQDSISVHLEKIGSLCENSTSELADVLVDVTDKKNILEDMLDSETIKN